MTVLQRLNIDVLPAERLLHYGMIVVCHTAVLGLILRGQWQLLGLSLGLGYVISQLGISFMYHRVLTHNAVQVPKSVEALLTFIGGLSLQGSSLGWVATHNAHHKHQGRSGDPHSPANSHWLSVQLLGYTFRTVSGRHAGRLLRSKGHLWFHNHYWHIYAPIFFGSLVILPLDWAFALIWAPVALTWQLQSLANTWGHNWGKVGVDEPHDSGWMFVFVLGDCWHASHHAQPGSVRFHKYDPIGYLAEKLFK